MSDVVWSINIMLTIMMVGVGICIYYIFKYDDFWPNGRDDTGHETGSTYSSSAEQSGEIGGQAS